MATKKARLLGKPKPVNLFDFAESAGALVVFKKHYGRVDCWLENRSYDNRFFDRAVLEHEGPSGGFTDCWGSGANPDASIKNLVRQIRGRTIVFWHGKISETEVSVPKNLIV